MLPKILKNDIRMEALYELTVEEFNSLRTVIKRLDIMDVYNVDASFLPWLAWWFRVDAWDDEWSEERQRESIANALILRKYKGTIWAVEHALELSLFEATVVPWYEMAPEGARGTFRIDAMPSDSRSLTQSDYATFITLTESNKQGSQHWKGNIKHDPNLGSAYAAPVIRSRKRWVSTNTVPLHVTGIVISPTNITVYEGDPVSVSAIVQMSDGTTTHDVRFESSDASIVTVDDAGLVTFAGEGNASVYAISTFNNISSAECVVSALHAIAPVAVSINESGPLYVSESGQFTATVTYSNSNVISSVDDASIVTFSSSDDSILTIDDSGNYTVLATGDVTITATSTEDAAIFDAAERTTAIDYDFVLTAGQPSTNNYYYGYGRDSYGNVDPGAWGDSEHIIAALASHSEGSSPAIYPLTFNCDAMELWDGAKNIKLKFFTDTEFVESPISNGFTYTQQYGRYMFDDARSVYVLFRNNENRDVYVKVLDESLDVNNTIEMTIGLYEGSSFSAWGYRATSSTGETSSSYNSGRAIEVCYVRDYYYGMALQSELDNEYWNGWEYMNATWEFEDGTSHVYAGRLLMHPGEGFYTSSVIDDELIALAENNIDKPVSITLSKSEAPSNVIEIEIGEVEIGTGDAAYGLRAPSSTGELIAGEFPDASPVTSAYVRTKSYGCVIAGASERTYWNYLNAITVTWEFEDETSYEFPEQLEYYYNSSTVESFYKSNYIDETLIEIISARVGQKAKIIVTEAETSKLLTYLHWELDPAVKA
ncbi:phage tail protein I [Vibrio alginolyticus]|uniref:phage tail protein I n=1 Tax=Vibrio alginolyticus TaxID=663 RepID=UPI0009BF8F77|nr:phage tail protein I [Vibrio alginolyticus]MBY7706047.1 phage tail protein I [Vibrio alginolyticus]